MPMLEANFEKKESRIERLPTDFMLIRDAKEKEKELESTVVMGNIVEIDSSSGENENTDIESGKLEVNPRKEYAETDRKAIEKGFKAKKILMCGIGPDEYNRVSSCETAKEIWEALLTTHEGISQVKQSKIGMLTTEYELFRMKDDESIQDMHTRFTSIINEFYSLSEIIPINKRVQKTLGVLPGSWKSKVNVITEAKDLEKMTIDDLIGNLKTYEVKKEKELERRKPRKEKNLVLEAAKRSSSKNFKQNDLCHKCGKPGHYIKECPFHKQDHYKNTDKGVKRNQLSDKKFNRRDVADNLVKHALDAWGDSSSESEDEETWDTSMMAVEDKPTKYESIFALMAKSEDEDDNENQEVNFFDVQKNLKNYSQKKFISLTNVLIDTYHSLINEKNVLNEEIEGLEQVRDDMIVNIVDLKEQIEELTRDNALLISHINKWVNTPSKGKQVGSETHFELESELKKAKINLSAELEKNKQLQEDLRRVKTELDKSLHWTCSSDRVVVMCKGNDSRRGIGYKKSKIPFNPHSKYVSVIDNWICTHCGNTGHYKDSCKARFQSVHRNRAYVEKKTQECGTWSPKDEIFDTVKGSSQKWFVDSGCSKHMTGRMENFLSLKALKGFKLQSVKCVPDLRQREQSGVLVSCVHYHLSQDWRSGTNCKRYKNIYATDFGSSDDGDLTCLNAVDNNAELWHRRLGHASFTLLNKLWQRTWSVGYQMLSSKITRGGKKYILVIVDNFSRFTWTLFLTTKDETFPVFVAFVKQIQDECNFTTLRTPQQNGVVERKNRTLEDMARTMLIASNVAKSFWEEAINIACHLINRCTIRSLLEKTPYALLNEKKPKLTYLKAFGCKCFILNNGKEALGKFDAKNELGRKGTQSGEADDGDLSIPNELLEIINGKAEMVNQVEASNEEDAVEYPDDDKVPGPSITPFEAEDRVVDAVTGTPDADQRSGDHGSVDENDGSNVEAHGPSSTEVQVSNQKHKKSHPLENVITLLDSDIQTMSKVRNMFAYSMFISQIEPKNIKEALKNSNWISAMQKEFHQFERNKMCHLLPRPADRTVIGTRWVFRNKLDEFGLQETRQGWLL
ncbi:uncharacterized protein LOC132619592 [Lycium barbarum]|uniref:uncharacterized protein LOC132619592 n=1 Tax=Lycium barbarum TaxID=112863 RepID=UPI00293E703C|nr:uncharacterized protein LOC132619592 [Lycium barbarum]